MVIRHGIMVFATLATAAAHAGPLVIAHRGASGDPPEHTLEAKALCMRRQRTSSSRMWC